MKNIITLSLLMCLYEVKTLNSPGPSVYVVTPASKLSSANEGRSAPFYYHNWMRRMDTLQNSTTTTSMTTPKVKTPDLIFAEFESESSDNMRKSIRKLLEKEKVEPKISTTSRPIYVPDEEETNEDLHQIVYGSPSVEDKEEKKDEITNYSTIYNKLYDNAPAPVYIPSTSESTKKLTTTTSTTTSAPMNVQNIWHIIDKEKYDQYSGKWNEVPISSESVNEVTDEMKSKNNVGDKNNDENYDMDENFSLPGFGTNPGNGAENESRAIRTEPNIRFPYVSLKPFQMTKPLPNFLSNSKKGNNNMFTSLDSFHDVKNPVRGEAQDIVHVRQPIDRYNPAQPYLPQEYGSKSKQSSPSMAKVTNTVANLVPPPLPPPQSSADDFPIPTSYESFPPYPSAALDSNPVLSQPSLKPPVSIYQPPTDDSAGSDSPPDDSNNDIPPPASFVPTLAPLSKPFSGYSYNKPAMSVEAPPPMSNMGGYTYSKPAMSFDTPPATSMGMDGYAYMKPQPSVPDEKPDFQGYHYDKPEPPPKEYDHPPAPPKSPSYGHHDGPHYHDSDYPELIYDKPHGGSHTTIESSDSKEKDMGMMPPPPPPDMKPDMNGGSASLDDHGFPHDFPGGFKYHDFDDHDHYHHHHHTTTTTTTTEMPRVNRYSYYYLGKKLYYLPLYFSVYFIVYVGALIIKAVLRHKIVYPNSWRPNDQTASFFSKRSADSWDFSHENLHEVTGRVTKAIAEAAEKYMSEQTKNK